MILTKRWWVDIFIQDLITLCWCLCKSWLGANIVEWWINMREWFLSISFDLGLMLKVHKKVKVTKKMFFFSKFCEILWAENNYFLRFFMKKILTFDFHFFSFNFQSVCEYDQTSPRQVIRSTSYLVGWWINIRRWSLIFFWTIKRKLFELEICFD